MSIQFQTHIYLHLVALCVILLAYGFKKILDWKDTQHMERALCNMAFRRTSRRQDIFVPEPPTDWIFWLRTSQDEEVNGRATVFPGYLTWLHCGIGRKVATRAVLHADETGWRGEKNWFSREIASFVILSVTRMQKRLLQTWRGIYLKNGWRRL